MIKPTNLNLSIQPDELDKFCKKLIKRSRDISKTHDALSTLEAFITTFANTANHPDACQNIENILHSFSEQTRQKLLEDKTTELIKALDQLNIAQLTTIHDHLSRNGFYQILETVTARLSPDEIETATYWCSRWVSDASQKAEQASGFPECYDLKKANIDIKKFQAMKDMNHFFSGHN